MVRSVQEAEGKLKAEHRLAMESKEILIESKEALLREAVRERDALRRDLDAL